MKTKKMKSNKMKTRRKHKKWGGSFKQGDPRTPASKPRPLTEKEKKEKARLKYIKNVDNLYADHKQGMYEFNQAAPMRAQAAAEQAAAEQQVAEAAALQAREEAAILAELQAAMAPGNTHRSATRYVPPAQPSIFLITSPADGELYVNIARIRSVWFNQRVRILESILARTLAAATSEQAISDIYAEMAEARYNAQAAQQIHNTAREDVIHNYGHYLTDVQSRYFQFLDEAAAAREEARDRAGP